MEQALEDRQGAETPPPFPDTNTGARTAWDEAFLRVQSYLRAHGMDSPVVLSQVTTSILAEAQKRARTGDQPVTVAMDVTHERIGAWFARSGHQLNWANERARAQGRLALVMADLPGRWAGAFLSAEPLPQGLCEALGASQILPGPKVRVSSMAPEPLEFGLPEAARGLPSKKFWMPARALVAWLLISGLFGVAWAATH